MLKRYQYILACVGAMFVVGPSPSQAQERAYFVTYDHYLEEAHNLEIAVTNTSGVPKHGEPKYHAPWLELEYGVSGWWTTELYLEGMTTRHAGSGFTGWRWENRFRPLKTEHAVNPIIYLEYEAINEASRIQKEIVGSGALSFQEGVPHLLGEHAREFEAKLILSSAARGWNISENFIVEKNFTADEGLELGYSVGVSRSLGGLASGSSCRFCREKFVTGMEAYGGLGSTREASLRETRHYLAPVIAWRVTPASIVKASVGVGLTEASDRVLFRVGYSYELPLGRRP